MKIINRKYKHKILLQKLCLKKLNLIIFYLLKIIFPQDKIFNIKLHLTNLINKNFITQEYLLQAFP